VYLQAILITLWQLVRSEVLTVVGIKIMGISVVTSHVLIVRDKALRD
jgi:hypothetical protein